MHPRKVYGIPWNYLKHEVYRLITFLTYPSHSRTSTILLASKGFSYLGNGSDYKLICVFCTAQLENPNIDNIDEEHKRLQADCPMVNGTMCDNISINERVRNFVGMSFQSPTASSTSQGIVRSSQPSGENISMFPNTTDLSDGDGTETSCNQIQNIEPRQITGNSTSAQNSVSMTTYNATVDANEANNRSQSNPSELSDTVQSNTQENSQETVGNPGSADDHRGDDTTGLSLSFDELAIITGHPKNLEYALAQKRTDSFLTWPERHFLKPADLVPAGLYYTGYGDCARCFYCGGGLRNWESEDNAWVEHARWFPRCPFLLLMVGRSFIDVVQRMQKEEVEIKYEDVLQRIQDSELPSPINFLQRIVEKDPAVLSLVDQFERSLLFQLAMEIHKSDRQLTSEELYREALKVNTPMGNEVRMSQNDSASLQYNENEIQVIEENFQDLRIANEELRKKRKCKICLDKTVAVVFLPCSHFVSCAECACALNVCPICRENIKGIVMGYI